MKNNLPNFLIVGAAKSGTSSMHQYLMQHPEVFMPSYNENGMKVKEPRFLISDIVRDRLDNGVWTFDEYASLFSKVRGEKAIGEATVLYLYYYRETIKNIKHFLGTNVRIIIMLRNPADRAYSAYQHVSRGYQENKSFEEALEMEDQRFDSQKKITPMILYKKMGLYFEMVKAYKESFDNIHIVFYEDFRDNIELEMNKVYDFLEISRNNSIDLTKKYNVGGKRWKNSALKYFIINDNVIKVILNWILPHKFKSSLRKIIVNISTVKTPKMKEKTRIMLYEFYREDIKKLAKLLNKNLEHWLD